jgi:hypothetical protein
MVLCNLLSCMPVGMSLCTHVFPSCLAPHKWLCIPRIDSFDVTVLTFISFLVVDVLLSAIKFVYCLKYGILYVNVSVVHI